MSVSKPRSCSLASLSSIHTMPPPSSDSFIISEGQITVEGQECRKTDKFSQLYSSTDILKWALDQWHSTEITKLRCSQYPAVLDSEILICTEAPCSSTKLSMQVCVNNEALTSLQPAMLAQVFSTAADVFHLFTY